MAAQATAKQQAAEEARQARKAAKQQKLAAERERRVEQNKLRQARAGEQVSTTAP